MTKAGPLPLAFGLVLAAIPAWAQEPVVVELFTSEGCSSCPPADALLAELAARPGVLALSFHVDYWDGLGWKDPYSSAAATARQRRYVDELGVGTLYTPQIVVDGRWQAVGSDRGEVARALAAARNAPAALPVALAVDRGEVQVTIGSGGSGVAGAVLLVGFDRSRTDRVARGENAGRTLAHADVVRGIAQIGRFDGTAATISAPIGWPAERLAAIVQATDGRILGAAVADASAR
jgi:hypothetical protein